MQSVALNGEAGASVFATTLMGIDSTVAKAQAWSLGNTRNIEIWEFGLQLAVHLGAEENTARRALALHIADGGFDLQRSIWSPKHPQ